MLTVDAPEGISVEEIVFPQASEFEQIGQAQPLLVFEHEFTIGVRLNVRDGRNRNGRSPRATALSGMRRPAVHAPVTPDVL